FLLNTVFKGIQNFLYFLYLHFILWIKMASNRWRDGRFEVPGEHREAGGNFMTGRLQNLVATLFFFGQDS
ncbi:hypothetical protein ACJX0J_011808, partial [Zea mays]